MRGTAFLAIFLLGVPSLVSAQAPAGPPQPTRIAVNLAGIGALSQSVDPGRFEVVLENRLPGARYEVVIKRELIAVAAIALAGIGSIVGAPKIAELTAGNCDPLAAATAALNEATSESQVPARRAVVDALITAGTCQDAVVQAEAKAAVEGTRQALAVLEIRPSERVTYTITRAVPEAQPQTWTLVLETEPRGEWVTTFGFSFVPDRGRRYNSEAIAGGKFKIVEEQNEWALKDPIPSVYFSWVSSQQKRRNGGWSPTAGFGVGGPAPSVFGGVSYTFNQNLSLITGMSVTGERRLNGRYQPNQELSENLSEEQLHRVVYRPSPVVAITIRFDGNPFKKEAKPTPPAVPAAAAAPAPAATTPKPGPAPVTNLAPNPPVAEASRESDIKLRFDARGNLRDPAAAAALQQRARTATDIFVVSHGWWNDESAADCFYRRIVGGIDRSKPDYLTEDRFKPLFVTVYWPSALFPMEPSDCAAEGRTESSAAEGFSPERVRRWAAVAFPDAAALPGFATETARVAALLERERTAALSDADSDALVVILVRWRAASGATGAAGEGSEPEVFTGTGPQIAQRWRSRPDVRGELAIPGLSNAKKWLNFGNAFTFWTMKERAGIVGSKGLYEILKALQPLRQNNVRIHLIGHSFGGKLVTAALTGTGGPMNRADSLVILQGAFSQFAFATRDEIRAAGVAVDQGGLYRDVIASSLVSGPVVATHSSADVPNHVLYPAGVALMNDVTEATRAPRFGSLGAQGIRGFRASTLNLSLQTIDTLGDPLPRAISVDGSNVILGHSDLVKPQLFKLIWDVVEHGR